MFSSARCSFRSFSNVTNVCRGTTLQTNPARSVHLSTRTFFNSTAQHTAQKARHQNYQKFRRFSTFGEDKKLVKSPINWKSVAAMVGVGVGLIAYMKYYRGLQHKNVVDVRTYGKPALGGPYDLVDFDGNKITNQTFLGEYILIYFGFTSCPDICPVELQKMKKSLQLVAKEKDLPHVRPVFITIDPERDTPELMKKYHKENDYPADMVWLTGAIDKIDAAAKQFHVYYSIPSKEERQGDDDYLVDHSIFFYLMDDQGEFLEFFGKNMNSAEVSEKMGRVLREHMAAE